MDRSSGVRGEQPTDGVDLGVELAPEHVGLGVEVPEEGTPADAGGGRDLVDRGLVEALLGEQAQGDQFQGAGAGPGAAGHGGPRRRHIDGHRIHSVRIA